MVRKRINTTVKSTHQSSIHVECRAMYIIMPKILNVQLDCSEYYIPKPPTFKPIR